MIMMTAQVNSIENEIFAGGNTTKLFDGRSVLNYILDFKIRDYSYVLIELTNCRYFLYKKKKVSILH